MSTPGVLEVVEDLCRSYPSLTFGGNSTWHFFVGYHVNVASCLIMCTIFVHLICLVSILLMNFFVSELASCSLYSYL